MPLTKDDLHQIELIIDRKFAQELSPIQADIDGIKQNTAYIKQYMQQEFRNLNDRLDRLETKIDSIKQMETEDVQAAFKEIKSLKKRISVLEQRLLTGKK